MHCFSLLVIALDSPAMLVVKREMRHPDTMVVAPMESEREVGEVRLSQCEREEDRPIGARLEVAERGVMHGLLRLRVSPPLLGGSRSSRRHPSCRESPSLSVVRAATVGE